MQQEACCNGGKNASEQLDLKPEFMPFFFYNDRHAYIGISPAVVLSTCNECCPDESSNP